MSIDPLRAKLAAGGVASGLVVAHSRTPTIARIAASCGFHWLFIDLEHGTTSLEIASQICVAALDAGITPFVTRAGEFAGWIGRALDGGAVGIVVPHIDSAADAKRAVDAARYPPARLPLVIRPAAAIRLSGIAGARADGASRGVDASSLASSKPRRPSSRSMPLLRCRASTRCR